MVGTDFLEWPKAEDRRYMGVIPKKQVPTCCTEEETIRTMIKWKRLMTERGRRHRRKRAPGDNRRGELYGR